MRLVRGCGREGSKAPYSVYTEGASHHSSPQEENILLGEHVMSRVGSTKRDRLETDKTSREEGDVEST